MNEDRLLDGLRTDSDCARQLQYVLQTPPPAGQGRENQLETHRKRRSRAGKEAAQAAVLKAYPRLHSDLDTARSLVKSLRRLVERQALEIKDYRQLMVRVSCILGAREPDGCQCGCVYELVESGLDKHFASKER